MNSLDLFLVQYGLAAIFIILIIKTIGIPIPIPADLIILTAAARVAQGKLNLGQAFIAIFVALVIGGLIQFLLARGPGRGFLYRFGRYIGHVLPLPWVALLVLVLLLTIFATWVVIRRRQKKEQPDVEGTSLELWHEGICPVCLALYAANQLRSPINVEGTDSESVQSTQPGKGSLTHGNNF